MICSVKGRHGYRYYEVPRLSTSSQGQNIALARALPKLPIGAKPAGSGARARGVICAPTFGDGLGWLDVSWGAWGTEAKVFVLLGAVAASWLIAKTI